MPFRRLGAYRTYMILEGVSALLLRMIFTATAIYEVTTVGLNPLQLVLVGTVLEATVFVFEIPTGVVADLYGRRVSVVVGFVLVGAGFLLEGAVPQFGPILLAQVLWGLGATFTSGATEAWISDEIGVEKAGRAFLRAAQLGQLGTFGGILLGAALGSVAITLPILLGGGSIVLLALFLALAMPEHGFTPTRRASTGAWQSTAGTLRRSAELVRDHPALLTILGIAAIYGMASEGVDRLRTAHMLTDLHLDQWGSLAPVAWLGLFAAVGALLSLGGSEIVRRRVDTNSEPELARALLLINGLLAATVIGFAFSPNLYIGVPLLWGMGVLRTLNGPLYTALINRRLEPSVRATLLSASGQADALGQIAGGPVVGLIGTLVSLRAAIAVAGAVLAPALLLYGRAVMPAGASTVESQAEELAT